MGDDTKARADAALERAVKEGLLQDPRPFLRPVLRYLRERSPERFQAAFRHFDEVLVPAVASGEDPVRHWADYGRLLAAGLGPGRATRIDAAGRATPADAAAIDDDALHLYLPDSADTPALVIHSPGNPSAAQEAAVELLILGRTTASRYGAT